MRLIFLPILIVSVLSANGQALWRNFFTTNQNPLVTVVAGSNATVQASTVGVNQRVFTVNSVPSPVQTNWPLSSITNANNLTNWALLPTNYVPPFAGFATNANFATNAANATNFWGILSPTNIPSLAYISNNVGNGTNVTLWGSNNVSRADGLGTTITPTIWLTNGTAAALGAQQASPALMLVGQGWRSGNSTTMPVSMGLNILPVEGSGNNPSALLQFVRSISNAAPSVVGSLSSAGNFTVISGITGASLDITGDGRFAAANRIYWNTRSTLWSPADSDVQLMNNASTAFSRLFFGPLNALWPALKVESTNAPTLSVRTGADGNYASLMASNVVATNMVIGTYGCFAMGTGVVAVATSTSTNVVGSIFNYADVGGSCGNETNSNLIVTNAGKYRISFGAGIAALNNPAAISLHLTTNGTPCEIVWIEAAPTGTSTYETGFKEFVVSLPALCRVSLAAGNAAANGVNLRNVCLNVKGPN